MVSTHDRERSLRRVGAWVNAYTALAMVTALAVPRFSWVLLIAAALAANQARLCWNEVRLARLRAENAELAEGARRLAEINKIAREMAASLEVGIAARQKLTNLRMVHGKCSGSDCLVCGVLECPHHDPLHFKREGCPACTRALRDTTEET